MKCQGKWLSVCIFIATPVFAQTTYQKPPAAVLDVLHAPLPPAAAVSPTRHSMILATPVRYPPIADLAQPMLRLAGVRISTTNNGIHNAPYFSAYSEVRTADGAEIRIALPTGARPGIPRWSADGKRYAFANQARNAVELWVGESGSPKVRRIARVALNPVLGGELQWMPDQRTLLVKLVPRGRGAPPPVPVAPAGPNVQETAGEKVATSTYEAIDLLRSERDAELFDYYATSQIALIDSVTGKVTPIGAPAIHGDVDAAPGGEYLLVETIHRPYSYQTAWNRFPTRIEVWNRKGQVVRLVADLPLADHVPIWGVRLGPREVAWRPTEPATLVWAEALDGGDWNTRVPHRDRVLTLKAPFAGEPTQLLETELRYMGLWWAEKNGLAFVREFDLIKHWIRISSLGADDSSIVLRRIWDRSSDERYQNPGNPVMRVLPSGNWVVAQSDDGNTIHLAGVGASPEGDRPFLDRFNLRTLKAERLFRSDKTSYEDFLAWTDAGKGEFLTRRESPAEPPNYFVRTLGAPIGADAGEAARSSTARAITHLTDPTPQIRGIQKRLVKYKRPDGVDLSFTLYLPPGYKEGTRLPAVVWAYPLDYADPSVAGQVAGSTRRFTILGWPLHLFFLLDGYAVIDNPSMPVVGDTNKIYDTYMEQLVAGAKAAVDKAVELGVVDPDRIGVTGHSHGGLMTANLLAHTDLFRAGIARSGAYNRSLTAFGFQNERRTLWQAPAVYQKVSALFSADKINEPLLLIHGELDVNPGTVPLQSERLFEAIRGTGGTARLVMLPLESHGYTAMESVQHVLYEMLAWFDHHVKHAPPRAPAAAANANSTVTHP